MDPRLLQQIIVRSNKSIGAVISSGENNIYGHPEIVKRYQERNISLYLTQERSYYGKHMEKE